MVAFPLPPDLPFLQTQPQICAQSPCFCYFASCNSSTDTEESFLHISLTGRAALSSLKVTWHSIPGPGPPGPAGLGVGLVGVLVGLVGIAVIDLAHLVPLLDVHLLVLLDVLPVLVAGAAGEHEPAQDGRAQWPVCNEDARISLRGYLARFMNQSNDGNCVM